MSHLLDQVQMHALGCLMYLKEKHTQNHFKQAFTHLAAQLDLDDVGYLYNPDKLEQEFYTIPGQLLGEVCNANFKPFNLGLGFNMSFNALNCLDEDYKKILVVITDNIKNNDLYYIKEALKTNKDINLYLFTFNQHIDIKNDLLKQECLTDISEIYNFLTKITF